MKLNLGCGSDIREGYVNVDCYGSDPKVDQRWNLTDLPWPWKDNSVEEILMYDVLEHFSYRLTDKLLHEAYRILNVGGTIDIQVPDFYHCALAAIRQEGDYLCNVCGSTVMSTKCGECNADSLDIAQAALNRLYGGQDVEGNWHHTAFTKEILDKKLHKIGFKNIQELERNQNNETYWQNWNFRLKATKTEDAWD